MRLFKSFGFKIAFFSIVLIVFGQNAPAQNNWSPVFRFFSTDLVSVYFTNQEKGFIGGDGGVFAFTNDGGQTWTKQPLNTNDNVNEIYFRNEDNGYLLVGKHIFITNDGGKSWRENQAIKSIDFSGRIPEFLSVRFAFWCLVLNARFDVRLRFLRFQESMISPFAVPPTFPNLK